MRACVRTGDAETPEAQETVKHGKGGEGGAFRRLAVSPIVPALLN